MNDRLTVPSAIPADVAERISDVGRDLTPAEQFQIEARAQELIAERLQDGARLHDLLAGIEPDVYEPHWNAALMHIDNALAGDPIATACVLEYVRKYRNVVRAAAQVGWLDECREIAEGELHD